MKKEPVHEQFLANAQAIPDAIAVERGEERITYRELERRSKALALTIQRLGLSPESPVAIYTADSCHMITAILGSLIAGVAFVPLDPDMPRNRLLHMVSQARPLFYLVESDLAAELIELRDQGTPGVPTCTFEEIAVTDDELAALRPVSWNPDGMCYVYFTSGSTGEAKGIAGRLKAVGHFIHWETETFALASGIRVSQLTLPSFDPFLRDSFVALCNGGTICVPDNRETVLDPNSFLNWLDRSRVEVIHCVPTLFRLILQASPGPERLPALKFILLAGEVLPPEDCAAFFEIFGERIGLVNLYGPSETTMVKLFHRVTPADCSRKSIPIGKPMAGARALLMDPRMKPTPPKSVGELYLRTPYRSLGYINRPDLTANVFIVNPFSNDPNDLIYKTGDFARMLDDESYEFLGRTDNQIKIRGVRIEPIEIESVIAQHPAVKEGAVAGRTLGTSPIQVLVAYVASKSGSLDINELRMFLQERLPISMVPSHFMELDKLPRTLQGKIDRKALPTPKSEQESTFYVAPRTPVEELISAIWADVLHRDRIGIYDNFFALGGHSLLATQVVIRIRHTFHVDIRLTKIFNTPTVAQMAAFIERERANGQMPSEPKPVDRTQDLPLSFVQQQLWFMDRLAPGSSYYNLPISLRFTGRLDLRLLERCLSQLVQRHEMLRTVFHEREPGHPVQKVLPTCPLTLTIVDLSTIEPEMRESALRNAVERAERRGFDLGQTPLLRLVVIREAENQHAAQLTMHHIVGDGWSIHVLLEELLTFYRAELRGETPNLAPIELQYGDYAHWQRQWFDEARLTQELEHWRETLQDAPELFGLPPDHPRPEVFTNRGKRARSLYSSDLVSALLRLSRQEDTTLFMTLTAGFFALLRWHSGSEDLIIGSDFANRQHLATERLIGCFVNQLPLRVKSESTLTFRELLTRTRETFLAAYAHQELPFIKLVESLRPKRQSGFAPLFQTKLVLQPPADVKDNTSGLSARPLQTEHATAQMDLILNMSQTDQGLEAHLEYCTDLYEASSIDQFLRQLGLVWSQVCATPEMRLEEIGQFLEQDLQERQAAQRQLEKASAANRLDKFKRRSSGSST